jgi:hypothetical protein
METKSCFVIGPIGDRHGDPGTEAREIWEQAIEIFEEVILPACSAFGLRPLRADQISQPGEIPEQIFQHLHDDDVVIADLTGANANVMYELGLRHTIPKLTIQIGERGKLPFDVAATRTILFKRTAAGLVEARKALSSALSIGLEGGGLPVAATRIWSGGPGSGFRVALPTADTLEEFKDELGFLEKMASMNEGVSQLPEQMTLFTSLMQEIGALVSNATERMERINNNKGSAGAKVEIANHLADQLQEVAQRLESNVTNFRGSVEQTDPGVRTILKSLPEEDAEQAKKFSRPPSKWPANPSQRPCPKLNFFENECSSQEKQLAHFAKPIQDWQRLWVTTSRLLAKSQRGALRSRTPQQWKPRA